MLTSRGRRHLNAPLTTVQRAVKIPNSSEEQKIHGNNQCSHLTLTILSHPQWLGDTEKESWQFIWLFSQKSAVKEVSQFHGPKNSVTVDSFGMILLLCLSFGSYLRLTLSLWVMLGIWHLAKRHFLSKSTMHPLSHLASHRDKKKKESRWNPLYYCCRPCQVKKRKTTHTHNTLHYLLNFISGFKQWGELKLISRCLMSFVRRWISNHKFNFMFLLFKVQF